VSKGKYLKARITDGSGRVLAKIRVRIPKKHRTKLHEWDQPADIYTDGVLEGIGRTLEALDELGHIRP
jgi:hypothetical protein